LIEHSQNYFVKFGKQITRPLLKGNKKWRRKS